jgi:hypothetical protein
MDSGKSFATTFAKSSESAFETHAIDLFKFQAKHNPVYQNYLRELKFGIDSVSQLAQIPFLPIEFFKSFAVKVNDWQPEIVFASSGTTGMHPSHHHIKDLKFYHRHAQELFENTFGPVTGLPIIALLPSYLERSGSSLVSMVDHLIKQSQHASSGFYLQELDEMLGVLEQLSGAKDVILFGVTFALLELADCYEVDLSHVTLIETGGMKGRREEITRTALYQVLQDRFKFKQIYSEYGMTELLSQAYGLNGYFLCPDSMKIFIRDINDPFDYVATGKTGGINVIDLANTATCAFIETKDIGRLTADGRFEVLGRIDNSEIRGCNLLIA